MYICATGTRKFLVCKIHAVLKEKTIFKTILEKGSSYHLSCIYSIRFLGQSMKNECAEDGILFFLKTGHTGYLKIEDFMPIKKM